MEIAIFTGELSGDLIGAELALALHSLDSSVNLWGLGSAAMQNAGVDIVADSAQWGAISITEALRKVPGMLLNVSPKVKKALKDRMPDLVILIDFGAFNVRVARYSKQLGLKVCYYFPPGSWRREGVANKELATLADLLVVPFSWSAERFQNMGACAVNVGHPVLERVKPRYTREQFADMLGLSLHQPIIGLLPGSREHEVKHLMPVMVKSAYQITRTLPDAQFVVGAAPTLSLDLLRSRISSLAAEQSIPSVLRQELKQIQKKAEQLTPKLQPVLVTEAGMKMPLNKISKEKEKEAQKPPQFPPIAIAKDLTYDVMAHSDALIICSGTATLEAACFATPMVILYRGSKVMEMEYRLLRLDKKIKFIGMPNILADRLIVPELIQQQADPDTIAEHVITMLTNLSERDRIKQDLQMVRESLGEPGASMRTAKLALSMVKGERLQL